MIERDSGSAMIEAAIVIPFLLMFSFGVISLGMTMYHTIAISEAARRAGRSAAIADESCEVVATTAFHNSLTRLGVHPKLDGDFNLLENISVRVTQTPDDITGLLIDAEVSTACPPCEIMRRLGLFNDAIRVSQFIPVEDITSGCLLSLPSVQES